MKPWTKDSCELRVEFRGVGKIYCDLSPGAMLSARDDTAGSVLGNIAARLSSWYREIDSFVSVH